MNGSGLANMSRRDSPLSNLPTTKAEVKQDEREQEYGATGRCFSVLSSIIQMIQVFRGAGQDLQSPRWVKEDRRYRSLGI